MLQGRNVLLGISGSIAAYKAAVLCRELVKKGANVKVLMTPESTKFISPLTLSTLSKNPVYLHYSNKNTGEWNNHVALAKWADLFLLAPATQNTIAKMANGICDNLLLATYFSMQNLSYFAPAMDLDMFKHPSNAANIKKLQQHGNVLIPAAIGELASGLVGEGRMAEIEDIIAAISVSNSKLAKKKIVITAGPTYEAIDPVRFIGNHSSGKMGYALANEASRRGAEVVLISGPTQIPAPASVTLKNVTSAGEMFQAVKEESADIFICSAAVADYSVKKPAEEKIKKSAEKALTIELEPTIDILGYLGENKTKHQLLIGFALETENEEANAMDKLKRKNCDLLVLNSLKVQGAGFGVDTNKIVVFDRDNNRTTFELKSKQEVAKDILNIAETKC